MKLKKSLVFSLIATLIWSMVATLVISSTGSAAGVLYVAPTALGSGDCSSWANACDLQTALGNAVSSDQLWIMQGVHIPGAAYTDTFTLKNGVALYGGFTGAETSLDERDWETHITVLSGDIDNNDITDPDGVVTDVNNIVGTNAYHVVTGGGTDATAVLDGLVITAGQDYSENGAGMYNLNSSPSLNNVVFSGNQSFYSGASGGNGGGMYNNQSSPTLTNVTFRNNNGYNGGGMYNISSNPVLTNVTFSGNTAMFGGGMYNMEESSPTLTSVTFAANTTANEGGGMYNDSSNLTLTNVTFSSNAAAFGSGMVNRRSISTLTEVTFANNTTTRIGYGGAGIYDYDSTLTLNNVTFSDNTNAQWGDGAGIYAEYSTLNLSYVLFSGNAAESGGGLYSVNTNATLTNVTFSGNTATQEGGGMYTSDGYAGLTNVTFAENTALYDGGGMYNYSSYGAGGIQLFNVTFSGNSAGDEGGGMANSGRSIGLRNITFTGNSAPYGGGLYVYYGSASVVNTILWGNTVDQIYLGSSATAAIMNCDIQGGGFPGTGNINADPILGELADNGGFTMTHALLAGSPAIDSASNDHCDVTDQRGYPRPYDGDENGTAVCDMGSFEVQPYTLTINTTGAGEVTASPDHPTYNYGDVVTLTATADPHWSFSGWSGDASGTDNPLTVTMRGNTSITATFTGDEHTLEVTVDPSAGGTVAISPDQPVYQYGDTVTLTPSATPGWSFSDWNGDASGTENPLVVTIQDDTSITANFTQDEYSLQVVVDPSAGGTVTVFPDQPTYHYGDTVTLTPSANPGWSFSGWSGDASGADDPLVVTIQDNTSITASFMEEDVTIFLYLPSIVKAEALLP